MEITHLGLGICSYRSLTAGAIFLVTVPETIMTSDWRGEGQGMMPKRSRSWRAMKLEIISMAQQARPKVRGQREDFLPQAMIQSAGSCRMPGRSCRYGALPWLGKAGTGDSLLMSC